MKYEGKLLGSIVLGAVAVLAACSGSAGLEQFAREYMEAFVGYFKFDGSIGDLKGFFDSRVMTIDGVKTFAEVAELFRSSRENDLRMSRDEDERSRNLYRRIVWKARLFKIRGSLDAPGAQDAGFFKAGDIIVLMRPAGTAGMAGPEGRKPDIAGQTFVIRRFPEGLKIVALL
jgi:hypothetical protein